MELTRILQIGAGRSTASLIQALADITHKENWQFTVIDSNSSLLNEIKSQYPNIHTSTLKSQDASEWENYIASHDVVISMVPAFLHPTVAKFCLTYKKHLFTASYISPQMKALEGQVLKQGLLFMNECGLDPGIDHMSAQKIIDDLHRKGATILGFESYCGGLVAPESDNNPWNYKFSWNPRNVVLAGQGMSTFIHHKQLKTIPYHQLFDRIDEVEIPGYGKFEGYANRDSTSYEDVYGLKNLETLYRGTLRKLNYCRAWNFFVQLGLTDDTLMLSPQKIKTRKDLFALVLSDSTVENWVEEAIKLVPRADLNDLIQKIEFLKLTDDIDLGFEKEFTPAQALQSILEKHWVLAPGDRDMIAMVHLFKYQLEGEIHHLKSYLVLEGKDQIHTAMAVTVGLPIAFAVESFMKGEVKDSGVRIPVHAKWHEPILKKLENYGVVFNDIHDQG
jgi:saccharopine dehydrogenase-like NADP-dependent oxidoreductase